MLKDPGSAAECEVVCERAGQVTLRIVPKRDHNQELEVPAITEFDVRWTSPSIDVEFEYPKATPREAAGKFRRVQAQSEAPC